MWYEAARHKEAGAAPATLALGELGGQMAPVMTEEERF